MAYLLTQTTIIDDHMNNKPIKILFLTALLTGFFATNFITIEAQVLTNRTPDKAKIQAETKPRPSPTPDDGLLTPDRRLSPTGAIVADTGESQWVPTLCYYIWLGRVRDLQVSDAKGRTDDLFRPGPRQLDDVGYHILGPNTVSITIPVGETYFITFESVYPAMTLEIIRGRGDVSPDEAVRYNDLVLDKGRGRLEVSATGIKPVRLDSNHDGHFESTLEPSAHVRGLAAKDKRGPEITFEVLERNATTVLIAIKAVDKATGVKSVFYSTDNKYDFPYEGPVRVNLNQATFIVGVADDNAGNRAVATYEFGKRAVP